MQTLCSRAVGASTQGSRLFSTSRQRLSIIGAAPIPVPSNVSLVRGAGSMLIRGPLGEASVPVPDYIHFLLPSLEPPKPPQPGEKPEQKKKIKRNPPCPPEALASPFTFAGVNPANTDDPLPAIGVFVADPGIKEQRQRWGLTRTLISNAIVGQTTGFTLPIYLLGVGFRAALETDPRRLPDVHKDVVAAGGPGKERQRLAMKLGYSHTVYVVVPEDIKITVLSPTIIHVFGTDKARVGEFAATIRRWRPPEPYKGKGVFVGDEKIKMKSGKKK